jgi:hypothetical protein
MQVNLDYNDGLVLGLSAAFIQPVTICSRCRLDRRRHHPPLCSPVYSSGAGVDHLMLHA